MKDPREYQLMVLTSMLIYGLVWLKFDLHLLWIVAMLATALLTQWIATRALRLQRFEWRSAMISGLSLVILMRSPSLIICLCLVIIAILSKFVFRWNGKHIFNPTNFALAVGVLGTSQVWISPGQWGHGATLAFFIFCMGGFVANKACRADVSFAFLLSYAAAHFGFALYHGDPFTGPIERLMTGSLLIFTFFMISDPISTPNSRVGRIIFGTTVALFAAYLQLAFGNVSGLIISLAAFSVVTPLLDKLLPAERFSWEQSAAA
jgi:enediyne biosynthesis protein E5